MKEKKAPFALQSQRVKFLKVKDTIMERLHKKADEQKKKKETKKEREGTFQKQF